MHQIHKKIVTDENSQPVAVQIDYADWLEIERLLESNGGPPNAPGRQSLIGSLQWDEDAVTYQRRMRESSGWPSALGTFVHLGRPQGIATSRTAAAILQFVVKDRFFNPALNKRVPDDRSYADRCHQDMTSVSVKRYANNVNNNPNEHTDDRKRAQSLPVNSTNNTPRNSTFKLGIVDAVQFSHRIGPLWLTLDRPKARPRIPIM